MNTEDILRRALEARAASVEVAPDALGRIRTRIAGGRSRRTFTIGLASLATGAVAASAAVVVALASNESPPDGATMPPGVSSAVTSEATPSSPPGTVARLPVYFVGVVRDRPVLYREFHSQTLNQDSLPERIRLALGIMLSVDPADPDYSSPWPAGASVRGVELEDGIAVVDLAGAVRNDVGSEQAHAAVQQLVWTVTGVTADRGVQLEGVRLLFDGVRVTDAWGHVEIPGDLTRTAALPTLADVWLISPQHGDTVTRTFTAHIGGAVPEATVYLRVRSATGVEVQRHTVTLSSGGPNRGEAMVPLTLAPGSYTLEAFYESPDDASEQALDDHDITVR